MEAKGTRAILNGQEVILITCAKGFWGSLGDGKYLRDGDNKIIVFTHAEAKNGIADFEASNPEKSRNANDEMVLAKIEGWKKLLQKHVSTTRLLAFPPNEGSNTWDKLAYELATKPHNDGFGTSQLMYRVPSDSDREKMVEGLELFDKLIAENKIVTLLMQTGIKQFGELMLSAGLENEYEMGIVKKCMNGSEIAKAMDYSTDNTWTYARIEVEKELALQPSAI